MAYNSTELGTWTPGLTEKVIISVVFGTVILVGIIGNVVIITLIIFVKKLRSVVNLCLASLAIADVVVLVVSPLKSMSMLFGIDDSILLKHCGIFMLILGGGNICSMLTFLLISVERYAVVVYPLKSIGMWTYKKASLLLVFIWTLSGGVGVPLSYFARYGKRQLDNGTTALEYCYLEDPSGWLGTYEFCVTFVTFFLPIPILFVLYVKMICALKQQVKQDDGNAVKKAQRCRKQVVWMLVALLIIFIICLLPIRIYMLINWYANDILLAMDPTSFETLWWFCNILLHVNHASSPIVYFVMSDNFRDPVKAFCCKKFKTHKSFGLTALSSLFPRH